MQTIDCKNCEGSDCDACYGNGYFVLCASCHDPITGCMWNGGRCYDCHNASLLPETALDRWEAEYAI